MSTYQKMTACVVDYRRGQILGITAQIESGDAVWDVPRPLIEVADNVVISPKPVPTDGGFAFLTNQWEIFQLAPAVRLPIVGHTQAAAVTIARDFRADPGISFASSADELLAWVTAYISRRASTGQR